MDQTIDNVFIRHEDLIRATDQAVWLNFKVRALECSPFFVIESNSGESAVVSDDVLEFLDDYEVHTIHEDYVDMSLDHIGSALTYPNHFSEIYEAFRLIDTNVLIFTLEMKIPLAKFIRHELARREIDMQGVSCSSDKAIETWFKEE